MLRGPGWDLSEKRDGGEPRDLFLEWGPTFSSCDMKAVSVASLLVNLHLLRESIKEQKQNADAVKDLMDL